MKLKSNGIIHGRRTQKITESIEWDTNDVCCMELRGALNMSKCVVVLDGDLHIKGGFERAGGDLETWYHAEPIKFCPFCGTAIRLELS